LISKIDFSFESTSVNNSTMGMEIITNTDRIDMAEMPLGNSDYSMSVSVPGTIKIRTYGKGPRDTIIDKAGKILKDKYILLRDLKIDRMRVCDNWLPNGITLHTKTGQTVQSNYWGFDGTVEIKIAPTVFRFLAGTYSR